MSFVKLWSGDGHTRRCDLQILKGPDMIWLEFFRDGPATEMQDHKIVQSSPGFVTVAVWPLPDGHREIFRSPKRLPRRGGLCKRGLPTSQGEVLVRVSEQHLGG